MAARKTAPKKSQNTARKVPTEPALDTLVSVVVRLLDQTATPIPVSTLKPVIEAIAKLGDSLVDQILEVLADRIADKIAEKIANKAAEFGSPRG